MESLLAGSTVTAALIVVTVRLFGALGALKTSVLFATLLIAAVTVAFAVWLRGVPWRLSWRRALSAQSAPLIVISCAAMCLAIIAAYYLPVWQWDALGYHLPYVNFALQRGTFGDIPPDVPYIERAVRELVRCLLR